MIRNALGKLKWGKRAYAVFVLCATTAMAIPAQTFTTLHSFGGTDGAQPLGALVQATDGNFYGTTLDGGPNHKGTIFKITPSGAFTTLYSFCSQSACEDGQNPQAGLVQAANGDVYGTTSQGGVNADGTVFKITIGGALTTLYSFCSQSACADGQNPQAGLVQATNGDFYGTTADGGAGGGGTAFKITPDGTLTTLYSFCSQGLPCTDGERPEAGLIQAANGDLYGTTSRGGAIGGVDTGTVFRITPSGALTTLHSFCCSIGANLVAGLVQGTDGDFYGTAASGGADDCHPYGGGGCGTVFKITPSGKPATLYTFCSLCPDGFLPDAGLVQGTDGDFYGTTFYGGNGYPGNGTIFKITPGGTLTTLYSFCSQGECTDGGYPYSALVQATNGDFYGTTSSGGASTGSAAGTIFSLSVGLGPFVKTLPLSGRMGVAVSILGSDLTGAASVSFNGTAAAFTAESRYLITATVPVGATTGTVQVVIPSGTLSSNVAFRVLP
ncbi:MAG: choice-of-anchor tandem repeat GloVer-containing protein [Bryobacteraceae bacterium]|jgi:uncharacterized repeat protein (TIGR03803 family)